MVIKEVEVSPLTVYKALVISCFFISFFLPKHFLQNLWILLMHSMIYLAS